MPGNTASVGVNRFALALALVLHRMLHGMLQRLNLARLLLKQSSGSSHLGINQVSIEVPVRHSCFLRIVK
jgi:hypothetical protein